MAGKTLPKTLYVKLETDRDNPPYFVADDTMYGLAEMGAKVRIGTYTLTSLEDAEVVVKTSL